MGKFIKNCQVCGGPISNGRCRYCGMPYRDDSDRYHLNESRRDHYQHSTGAVRRRMENEERALPDQQKPQNPPMRGQSGWNQTAQNRSTVGRSQADRTAKKEAVSNRSLPKKEVGSAAHKSSGGWSFVVTIAILVLLSFAKGCDF